jgi:hypothetical protein
VPLYKGFIKIPKYPWMLIMTTRQMFLKGNIQERKVLHKERISTGSHTYFLELKEATNGSKYIIIDQSKKVGNTFEHTKIRIFEDEILEFQRQFKKMVKMMLED